MKVEIRENHPLATPEKMIGDTLVMVTPNVNEDFWLLRVPVSKSQAVVAFPKFSMLGIGFQFEDKDWNTNLPWSVSAEEIYDHIKINRKGARKPKCIQAIELLQQTIREKNFDPERNDRYDHRFDGD